MYAFDRTTVRIVYLSGSLLLSIMRLLYCFIIFFPSTDPKNIVEIVTTKRMVDFEICGCLCDTKSSAFLRCGWLNQYLPIYHRCQIDRGADERVPTHRDFIVILKCTSTQLILDCIKGPLPYYTILYYAIMYIHNVKHDDASSLFVIRANAHTHDKYVIM